MEYEYKTDEYGRKWYWINGKIGYLLSVWTEEEAREDFRKYHKNLMEG